MAIYKPQGTHITKKTLKHCWDSNGDGAGFMYADNEKLYVIKGLMDFKSLYKTYRAQENRLDTDYVIHFRIGTAGKNDKANCHPFKINENTAFVHNGILNCVGVPRKSLKSDTAIFCRDFLQKLSKDFLSNDTILDVLETIAIAENSKFIFMDNFGFVHISNEFAGVWDKDIWYSNYGYKPDSLEDFTGFTTTKNITRIEEQDWSECTDCGAYYPVEEMNLVLEEYNICDKCYKWHVIK